MISSQIIIGRSFRDSNNEKTENFRMTNSSTTAQWLNNEGYTGFWIVYSEG